MQLPLRWKPQPSRIHQTLRQSVPMQLKRSELWSVDTPTLFGANITLNSGADEDTVTESFGVRTLSFTTKGFLLNGVATKLRGGAMHHDNGPLGSAAIDRAEERRIQILRHHDARLGATAAGTLPRPVANLPADGAELCHRRRTARDLAPRH